MSVNNPFADDAPTEREDQNLVALARSGNRRALEDLIQQHQGWIYNIALRMLFHPQDAEDATQEILVKVLTRLSSFEGRSLLPHLALPYRRQPRTQYETRPSRGPGDRFSDVRRRTRQDPRPRPA